MRCLTLVAALSVSVITSILLWGRTGSRTTTRMLPGGGSRRDLHLAGGAVRETVELDDHAVAPGLDEPLDETAVQVADELGVDLGELLERAAGEGDRRAVGVDDAGRVE